MQTPPRSDFLPRSCSASSTRIVSAQRRSPHNLKVEVCTIPPLYERKATSPKSSNEAAKQTRSSSRPVKLSTPPSPVSPLRSTSASRVSGTPSRTSTRPYTPCFPKVDAPRNEREKYIQCISPQRTVHIRDEHISDRMESELAQYKKKYQVVIGAVLLARTLQRIYARKMTFAYWSTWRTRTLNKMWSSALLESLETLEASKRQHQQEKSEWRNEQYSLCQQKLESDFTTLSNLRTANSEITRLVTLCRETSTLHEQERKQLKYEAEERESSILEAKEIAEKTLAARICTLEQQKKELKQQACLALRLKGLVAKKAESAHQIDAKESKRQISDLQEEIFRLRNQWKEITGDLENQLQLNAQLVEEKASLELAVYEVWQCEMRHNDKHVNKTMKQLKKLIEVVEDMNTDREIRSVLKSLTCEEFSSRLTSHYKQTLLSQTPCLS